MISCAHVAPNRSRSTDGSFFNTLHAALLWVLLALLPSMGIAQTANDGFDPLANQNVWSAALQPDGKILIGGEFTSVGGQTRNHLARLNADGTLDNSFMATDVDNVVFAIAVQSDGRIVIGGMFAQVGSSVRNGMARLNADGSVDVTFNPNVDGFVLNLVEQSNGQVLAGGLFTTLSPNGGAPISRNNLVRLNADGSVDASYDPSPDGKVLGLALQRDGRLVLGGLFAALTPSGGASVTRHSVARLNVDGSVDLAFDPNANGNVNALAVQADGKLLVGGTFSAFAPSGGAAIARNNLARLNANGSVDAAYNPNPDGQAGRLALQADGKLIVGGYFTSFAANGGAAVTRNNLARVNVDGSVDTTFNPNASGLNDYVTALVVQADGKLVVGGEFHGVAGPNYITRLNVDASLETSFDPDSDGQIFALAIQPDGKLLVGGLFYTFAPNGGSAITRSCIARLTANGSVDAFNPSTNDLVSALALLPNGKVVAAGYFTALSPNGGMSLSRNHIVRLNADGTADISFDPNVNGNIYAMALQPDGKLVIGGAFTALSPNGGSAIARSNIARLNVDGSVDVSFDPQANDAVYSLALQADGKLLVAGMFTTLAPNGTAALTRNRIARLNSEGSVDASFNPNANDSVLAVSVQADGKLVLGGNFSSLAPNGGAAFTRHYLARLSADGGLDASFDPNPNARVYALSQQLDGKLVTGGAFTSFAPNGGSAVSRNRVARLNTDGSMDASYDPDANGFVLALALQADGKHVLGGDFSTIGGRTRRVMARLGTPQAALQFLNVVSYSDGTSTVKWSRSGAGAELVLPPQLLFSLAGSTYAPVGTMQHVQGGWQLDGFVPPLNQTFYLRTRAQVSSGTRNGSNGVIESTRQFYLSGNDGIFTDGFE